MCEVCASPVPEQLMHTHCCQCCKVFSDQRSLRLHEANVHHRETNVAARHTETLLAARCSECFAWLVQIEDVYNHRLDSFWCFENNNSPIVDYEDLVKDATEPLDKEGVGMDGAVDGVVDGENNEATLSSKELDTDDDVPLE